MIYRPIRTNRLNQGFGENQACIKTEIRNGAIIASFPMRIMSKIAGFCLPGYKNFYTWYLNMKGHNGEDWKVYHGEPLYFGADMGTDWYAKSEADIGVRLDIYSLSRVKIEKLPSQAGPQAIQEWKNNDGMMYVKFVHAHLKDILWANEKINTIKGEHPIVKFGYQIGWADNTGASSGDHLHISLKFVDLEGTTLDKNNGYNGAFDFREIGFENEFVGDIIRVKKIEDEMKGLDIQFSDILRFFLKWLEKEVKKTKEFILSVIK